MNITISHKRRIIVALTALLAVFTLNFRDDDPVAKAIRALERMRTEFPQEKVYLQLDKPYYSVGDTLWFSAYVVDAESSLPSAKSTVVYADLVNEQGATRRSIKLPVTGGRAGGSIVLSDTIADGYYRLRAYTNWMRNFGEEYFYDHTFYIGNALANRIVTSTSFSFSKIGSREFVKSRIVYTDFDGKPLANKTVTYSVDLDSRNMAKGTGTTDANGVLLVNFTNGQAFNVKKGTITTNVKVDEKTTVTKLVSVKATADASDLQFFPEGGDLVDSLRSRVAFKLTGEDGLGIAASGYLVNKANERVAELKTTHAGMGSFRLLPLPGETYVAHLTLPDGSEKALQLPVSKPQGYVMQVTAAGTDSILVRIAVSGALAADGPLTVVGQSQHVVAYVSKSNENTRQFSARIPRSKFAPGIVQLTLFNPAGAPVAERIFFNRGVAPSLNVSTEATYKPRQKVTMDVALADATGKPLAGTFSAAVTNFTRVPSDENTESSILSELLLNADIRGYIEHPNYYFTAVNADKDAALDLLMLTQGWRRFAWSDLLSGVFPSVTHQPETTGLTISGHVYTNDQKPVARGKVTVMSTSGASLVLDTLTDADGAFRFPNLLFGDKATFVVQARSAAGKKNVFIELDRASKQFENRNENLPDVLLTLPAAQLTYLKNKSDEFEEMRRLGLLKKTIVLNEVKLSTRRADNPAVRNSNNLNGAGRADAVISGEQLERAYSIQSALMGRVAGLYFSADGNTAYLTRSMSLSGPIPMTVMVDGMQFSGGLNSIPTNDVEAIEVLKDIGNTAIYGIRGGGGVLVITTKRGSSNASNYTSLAPGIATLYAQGYSETRQFYSPVYDKGDDRQVPDFRSTIYWNPVVGIPATGKTAVEFYTADTPGQYRVVMEGIAGNGTLARKVVYFTVR